MLESTLRRLFLLTFSPVLKYSLGQAENRLDFRQILDSGTSVIFDLGKIRDNDARRLLGCLITIGYETAALSRGPSDIHTAHHLMLDEFADYSSQSEEALSRMLSGARKYGLFCLMAHQTWNQASARLQGALQNVGVKIAMRLGRADAEALAKSFGTVDPLQVKAEPASAIGQPVFMELGSQWESWVRTLTDLPAREALVKVADRPTVHIKTLTVPSRRVDAHYLEAVKQRYRDRLMVLKAEIVRTDDVDRDPPTRFRRTVRREAKMAT
jgi:hypothetical protein